MRLANLFVLVAAFLLGFSTVAHGEGKKTSNRKTTAALWRASNINHNMRILKNSK